MAAIVSADLDFGLEGLSTAEAERRRILFGANRLIGQDRAAGLKQFLAIAADPMALMLFAVAGLYFAMGHLRDAIAMLVAVVPVLGVDVVLEARSRSALKALAAHTAAPARVKRDGVEVDVPSANLVAGDLLILTEGDLIHADGVVRSAANLSTDESMLTGEAEPQRKHTAMPGVSSDEATAFFAGSVVVSGHGFGEITTIGQLTRYGAIARSIAETEALPSPLQRRTSHLVKQLALAAGALAVMVTIVERLRGHLWLESLLGGISLAMAAVPEEFPLVLTLFLSVGAWRLGRRGVLVRRLTSVESLGATTVICTDKTGTLTMGQFTLGAHVTLDPRLSDRDLLEVAVLACEAQPADPIERAIVEKARSRGVLVEDLAKRWELVRDHDFDPVGKHMSHVWRDRQAPTPKSARVVIKGALEGVLEHCVTSAASRAAAEVANAALAGQAMRVLAVAESAELHFAGATRAEDEGGLTLVGLLAFSDPLRPEAPGAVADCRRAGIRIKLVTGDHALTAWAIAEQAGIDLAAGVLAGPELALLAPEARRHRVRETDVFARISPEQKHLIIEDLQAGGDIVAMTGDGINDAPALRRADIGISMGPRATAVARAVAGMVLLEDNLTAIVAAVRQGREILRDIQRVFLYLIAFHIPVVALALLAPLAGLPLLLLPIHLVWLELIVHPVSALAFQSDGAATDVMHDPPYDPAAPLLPVSAVRRSCATGVLLTVTAFGGFAYFIRAGVGLSSARSAALATLLIGYQALALAEWGSLAGSRGARFPRSWRFWLPWILTGLSLPLALYVPPVARLLDTDRLSAGQLGFALCGALAAVGWRFANRSAKPLLTMPTAGWLYDLVMKPLGLMGLRRLRRQLVRDVRGRTLEVGVGTGLNLDLFNGGAAPIFALDIDRDALLRARRRVPRALFVQASVEALPFREGAFDSVVSCLVFCSVPHPAAGLAEVRRVLKSDGELRMLEHVRPPQRFVGWLADCLTPTWSHLAGGCHLNRRTTEAMAQAGLCLTQSSHFLGGTIVELGAHRCKQQESALEARPHHVVIGHE